MSYFYLNMVMSDYLTDSPTIYSFQIPLAPRIFTVSYFVKGLLARGVKLNLVLLLSTFRFMYSYYDVSKN